MLKHGVQRSRLAWTVSIPLGLLGLCLFAVFILPYLSRRTLNLGTVTGLIISLLLMAYAVWMPSIHRWLYRLWHGRMGKTFLCVCLSLVALTLAATVAATACMIHAVGKQNEEAPVAVVLGCAVIGERPSQMLSGRIDAAYHYLVAHPQSVAVLSGGQGHGENISEAECMRRELVMRGIAHDRLYLEDRSTSTQENLSFTLDILEREQLGKDVVIVTNEFHQYRAARMARALGLTPSACIANTPSYLLPTYYLRELYAIVYEWCFSA